MHVLLSLSPDLAIIALGYLLGKFFHTDLWPQIDKLCYFVLYPALMFVAASQRAIAFDTLLLYGSLGWAVVTAGFLLALLAKRLRPQASKLDAAGMMQNAWRFNTALGFVAAGALQHNAIAVAAALAVIVGIAIPTANLYAIVLLTRGKQLSTATVTKEVLLNPFLLASIAGVGVALTGYSIPSVANAFAMRLADAAIPIVLLSLGAALRSTLFWPPEHFAILLHSIKLILLPSLVWLVATLLQVKGVVPASVLIFAALPTASAAHVLAARYGANRSRVALTVMQSTALSLLTLPLFTALALTLF